MNAGQVGDILDRIGEWLSMASGLLGPEQDELALIPVSDRHKTEHVAQVRKRWETRHTLVTTVAAHLAALASRGFPDGVAIRIVRQAISSMQMQARGEKFLAKMVREYEEQAERDLYVRLVAAWLLGVPPDVSQWWDQHDTAE